MLQLTGSKWVTDYVYQTILLGSSHNGEHVSEGEGKRPRQKVYSNGCPFSVRVSLKLIDKAANKFQYQIVKAGFNTTHSGHPVSEQAIKTYQVKR